MSADAAVHPDPITEQSDENVSPEADDPAREQLTETADAEAVEGEENAHSPYQFTCDGATRSIEYTTKVEIKEPLAIAEAVKTIFEIVADTILQNSVCEKKCVKLTPDPLESTTYASLVSTLNGGDQGNIITRKQLEALVTPLADIDGETKISASRCVALIQYLLARICICLASRIQGPDHECNLDWGDDARYLRDPSEDATPDAQAGVAEFTGTCVTIEVDASGNTKTLRARKTSDTPGAVPMLSVNLNAYDYHRLVTLIFVHAAYSQFAREHAAAAAAAGNQTTEERQTMFEKQVQGLLKTTTPTASGDAPPIAMGGGGGGGGSAAAERARARTQSKTNNKNHQQKPTKNKTHHIRATRV